jgi:hypothetical protein
VAALKAQYASLPPEQRVFDEGDAGPSGEAE